MRVAGALRLRHACAGRKRSALMSLNFVGLWALLGAAGVLLGLRYLLHRGLAPASTVAAAGPALGASR